MRHHPTNRTAKTAKTFLLLKPKGELTPRVKGVGPEHFGIVASGHEMNSVDSLATLD
jgi:hypothetical protein